jgi:hypothetical protein
MSHPQTHVQRIRSRKLVINLDINSQIRGYQKKLVELSFSKDNVSNEYYEILDKIKFLRKGLLAGKLRVL